tara:strand:- start:111 stop:476 length:366 start_codon:yes stop_codon:yes gene_type:complete
MIDEKIIKSLKEEDIVVCIRPTVVNKEEWSGDVSISIMAGRTNPLLDEDYYSLLHFAKMVCASVPLMEKSEELREMIHNYVLSDVDNQKIIEHEDNDRGKVLDRTDNVITISFGTKTKGTA